MSTHVGTAGLPRYMAAWMDHFFVLVLVFTICSVAGAVLSPFRSTTLDIVIGICLGIGMLVVYLLYFFLLEWAFDATMGKMIMGLTIRKLDGSRCDLKGAFFRTITRVLEVNPFFLGFLPAAIIVLNSQRRQRWGDMLGQTVVIKVNSRF